MASCSRILALGLRRCEASAMMIPRAVRNLRWTRPVVLFQPREFSSTSDPSCCSMSFLALSLGDVSHPLRAPGKDQSLPSFLICPRALRLETRLQCSHWRQMRGEGRSPSSIDGSLGFWWIDGAADRGTWQAMEDASVDALAPYQPWELASHPRDHAPRGNGTCRHRYQPQPARPPAALPPLRR